MRRGALICLCLSVADSYWVSLAVRAGEDMRCRGVACTVICVRKAAIHECKNLSISEIVTPEFSLALLRSQAQVATSVAPLYQP